METKTGINFDQVRGLTEFVEEVRQRLKTLEFAAQKIAPEEMKQAEEQILSQQKGHAGSATG